MQDEIDFAQLKLEEFNKSHRGLQSNEDDYEYEQQVQALQAKDERDYQK